MAVFAKIIFSDHMVLCVEPHTVYAWT